MFSAVKAWADADGKFHAPEIRWRQEARAVFVQLPGGTASGSIHLSVRRVEFTALRTFGREHSKNVHSYGPEVPLEGEWRGNVFAVANLDAGSYLLFVRYRSGGIGESYAGPLIEHR